MSSSSSVDMTTLRQQYAKKIKRRNHHRYDCMWKLDSSLKSFHYCQTPISDFMAEDSKYEIIELYPGSMMVKVKYVDYNGEYKEEWLAPRRRSSMFLPTFASMNSST